MHAIFAREASAPVILSSGPSAEPRADTLLSVATGRLGDSVLIIRMPLLSPSPPTLSRADVLLSGAPMMPLLADFGLARLAPELDAGPLLTTRGGAGSPGYQAPEVPFGNPAPKLRIPTFCPRISAPLESEVHCIKLKNP